MRHRKKVKKLSRTASHRRAMLRNMLTSLFKHETITTTVAKAKAARQVAERLIKYAISGTLADKRRIIAYLKDRDTAHKLIRLGKEKFADRPRGGYTAIYRLGFRKGDGAELALLKLLVEPKEKKRRKKRPEEVEEAKVIEAAEEEEFEVFKEEEFEEELAEEAGIVAEEEETEEEAGIVAEETEEKEEATAEEKPTEGEAEESSAEKSTEEAETNETPEQTSENKNTDNS